MEQKTFINQVNGYIEYFRKNFNVSGKKNLSDNMEYMRKYCNTVLNTLSVRFKKEHPMENNFAFLKAIDVMKTNLIDAEFEEVAELVNAFLDDLEFLRNRFNYEPIFNSVYVGGVRWQFLNI